MVRIHEVGPRDGLQNESVVLPTEVKAQMIQHMIDAGHTDIEVTSFVRPSWVPQLADAPELLRILPTGTGVRFWALVPNMRGYERAVESSVEYVATVMSVSSSHNQRNLNRTVAESHEAVLSIVKAAQVDSVGVRCYLSTAFGCPIDGDVSFSAVSDIVSSLVDAGATCVVLSDTTGVANPRQVGELISFLVDQGVPVDSLAVHFHDNRGTALVNAYAAFRAGVRHFDAASGGVGGCPFAPGAAGNLATEDLVYMLHAIGEKTTVDLARSCVAAEFIESSLGHELPGRYHGFARSLKALEVKRNHA